MNTSWDLREWIRLAEERDIIKLVEGADPVLEIGALTELMYRSRRKPAVLFDNIQGYKPGFRLITNVMATEQSLALTLGLGKEIKTTNELSNYVGEKLRSGKLIPPVYVSGGPVMENQQIGEEVNVEIFPAPLWHPLDGGRYIGTGSATITCGMDDNWVNLGTYRIMVVNRNTVSFYISPGKHAKIHREQYFNKNKPCPVAISLGHDPLLLMATSFEWPYGKSEYDIVGGVKGQPVEVITGKVTGLPIPAWSEIVLEGEALPDERSKEGPFGEWTGYYASGEREEIVVRVKAVYYRNNPIILGAPTYKPPSPNSYYLSVLRSAKLKNDYDSLGVPGICGVWCPEEGGSRLLTVISVKQSYPGHVKQVASLALGIPSNAYMGRYIILVDDDVDPTNISDVLWAVCTRSDPAESIDFLRDCWSSPLDPMVAVNGGPTTSSRALINACRPFRSLNKFPEVLSYDGNFIEHVKEKWAKLLLSE